MAITAINVNPLNCRWVEPGSEIPAGQTVFALCVRVQDLPRIVTDAECAGCPLWEDPDALLRVARRS